ncbi:MAG: hypothetical protein IJS81_00275 [Selenomonadaceae bacterium]|nr:hypothetical protein [Selenomonadaceae bacterium]MBQ7628642.1 hypothetical protein [Selenomonadaceae bacterium]
MSEKFFGKLQTLRQKIRDDIKLAKNPCEILLSVAKEIGTITGEENFYPEIREEIISVYGHVFNDEKVLEIELQEISARREKIQDALNNGDFSEDEKLRIQSALNRHDAEIERLNSILVGREIG